MDVETEIARAAADWTIRLEKGRVEAQGRAEREARADAAERASLLQTLGQLHGKRDTATLRQIAARLGM